MSPLIANAPDTAIALLDLVAMLLAGVFLLLAPVLVLYMQVLVALPPVLGVTRYFAPRAARRCPCLVPGWYVDFVDATFTRGCYWAAGYDDVPWLKHRRR